MSAGAAAATGMSEPASTGRAANDVAKNVAVVTSFPTPSCTPGNIRTRRAKRPRKTAAASTMVAHRTCNHNSHMPTARAEIR